MKIIKTIAPDTVGPNPDRYQAVCRYKGESSGWQHGWLCGWESVRARYPESVEAIAEGHVRQTNHMVEIVEHEA